MEKSMSDPMKNREQFAISLRKKKKAILIKNKRKEQQSRATQKLQIFDVYTDCPIFSHVINMN